MAKKTGHLVGPLVALVALVAAIAALLTYSASPAHARFNGCTTYQGNDTTYRTCTFLPSGSEDTFVVPEGEFHYGPYKNTIHVAATSAPGAEGFFGGPAGRGATVSGNLKVTPGQTLYVNVGGAPTHVAGKCLDPPDTGIPNVPCIGGFNGGGSSSGDLGGSGLGGGGGGASDVRTVSTPSSGDQSESLNSRLIVAAGGGGSGAGRGCGLIGVILTGGTGGDARSNGGDGQPCLDPDLSGGTGGDAGSRSGGGSGGIPGGHSGSLGLGGSGGGDLGGNSFGGGGGGGYYGGGGGGGFVGGGLRTPPAGGGGGGSNLIPTGGTQAIATTGPSITITHSVPEASEPPPGPDDKQACKKGGYEALGFKNQGQCIKAVNANNR